MEIHRLVCSYYSPHIRIFLLFPCVCKKQQSQLLLSPVEMNGLCPPLTNASVPAYVADKGAKAASAFVSHSMFFLIYIRIVLYRHRKSGRHLGAKTAKIIVALSVSIYEKAGICKGFHDSRLLDSTKSNTIFYGCDGYPLKRVSFCCIINRIMGMQA